MLGIRRGIISSMSKGRRLKMKKIRESEALLSQEIERIIPQIENMPTEYLIKRKTALIKRTINAIYSN